MSDTVHRVFRVSAVRRPADDDRDETNRRVTTEEIVHELWTGRQQLQEALEGQVEAARSVVLEAVSPDDGVLVEFRFEVAEGADELPDLSGAVLTAVAQILEERLRAPIAVSASPVPPNVPAGRPTPWTQIAPVLAAIGTGIGVIGFVTFVGGAVVWARLQGAGFPAAPALGVIPSQDLVVIGTETLVPLILVAIGVVVVLTILYSIVRLAARRLHTKLSEWLVHLETAAQAGEAFGVALFAFLLVFSLAVLLQIHGQLRPEQFLLGVVVSVLLASVGAIIASRTRRLLYLATSTFVLVGVFLGLIQYLREAGDERVRGAALVRDHKKAIVGIFVAESASRVYIARVSENSDGTLDGSRSRLLGVAKDDVTDVAIADRKPIKAALEQGDRLAKELCELEPKAPTSAEDPVEDCRTAPAGYPQP
jgi:hypothetical protein